jgi:hypothetical protein
MFDAQLARQVEGWKKYWETVPDSGDVDRQLRKLRWLEEFAFHSGTAVSMVQYQALEMQIVEGEKMLAEMSGFVEVGT